MVFCRRPKSKPTVAPTTLLVTSLEAVTPASMEASTALWNPSYPTPSYDPKLCSAGDIDVFVSHCWRDRAFIEHRGELFYWDLKTSGVIKGVNQLTGRQLNGFLPSLPSSPWRFWLDRRCVDQTSSAMKVHTASKFDEYIVASKCLVVLMSPTYLTRLWCVFEYCCFLAHHSLHQIAVYVWAFIDHPATSPLFLSTIRGLSTAALNCDFPEDKKLLEAKVLEYYNSIEAFERFAKFSAIAMVCHSLLLSPSIYSSDRYRSFILPFLELAEELGFLELRAAIENFDAVGVWIEMGKGSSPDENPEYTKRVLNEMGASLGGLLENERKIALKSRSTRVVNNY